MKFFLLYLFLFVWTPAAHASIVINEIFPKPSDETSEWIELYNNGSESVSMDRWKLQNSDGTIFIMNASSRILAHDFLTFFQSQSNLNLNNNGDSVQLIDENNNQVDSQNYPGILGYNTSMGRSSDGAGYWTICISPATLNKPNNCPPPSPSPTQIPTQISSTTSPTLTQTPTATAIPTSIVTLTPTTIFTSANEPVQSQVLGTAIEPSAQPDESDNRFWFAVASFCVASLAAAGLTARLRKKK